ncbi:MAG: NACHT domain-containing protein, partial [Symploca sp. SIO2D2]|nr:NACHT domain-containing protein [Symploca sp. SIO2D2]
RRLRESNELEAEIDSQAWERYKKMYYEQPVRSILDLVNQIWDNTSDRYLVILGDPGSGKSMFLQYLALNWARSPLDNAIELPIPLLIELRTYNRDRNSKCKDLLEFFHKGNVVCRLNQHQLQEKLKAGKVLVMFDGLDEVFDPTQRDEVITDIHRFTNEYPQVRVIVTSRIIGYKPQRLRDAEFRHFLLHQWDVERKLLADPRINPVTIDDKDKQAMLRQIAHFMQAADKGLAGNLIRGSDLERILIDYLDSIKVGDARTVARLLIEQLRSRNFILCFLGGDSYGFVHRTFLEYFCAWEHVWQFQQTQRLSIEELKTEVFGNHWQDESWHEVLRLIAGMIDARFTGEIIDYLISQDGEGEKFSNLFLAAECLAEVRSLSGIATTANKLLEQLKGLTKYDLNYDYTLYGEDGDLVRGIRTQAVAAVAMTWQDNRETLPWLKQLVQSDDNGAVRSAAVREIARGWKGASDTLPWLKQWAQSTQDGFVRSAAVEAIALGWKDEPDTLLLLQQKAQSDEHWVVQFSAVREIARGWKDDPDTLPLLQQWAKSDKDGYVRSAAVEGIARSWKDDPDTLPLLQQWAKSDQDGYVRRAALEGIAHSWQDDPDTLLLLQQRVKSDKNERVRSAAVEEIARGWKDEPWMLGFLCDRVLNDPFERIGDWQSNPRQSALKIIIEQYPKPPQILNLLRDRAENDSDEQLREFASQKLAELL